MTERTKTAIVWGVVAGATAVSVALWPVAIDFAGHGDVGKAIQVSIGWGFVIGGALALRRRPGNRIGAAMIATGVAWWLGSMLGTRVPILWTIALMSNSAYFPFLVFTFLAFPIGRLGWWLPRLAVGLAATAEIVGYVIANLFSDPRASGCTDCQPGLNVLLIEHKPELATFLNFRVALSSAMAALAVTLGLLVIR
nr:hypothetical protein [Actinomycetota bacterium]